MNLHHADILTRLGRFLDRKQMPKRLEGKPAAEADEISALCVVVASNAPRGPEALEGWWPGFETRLGTICGGMWPTEKEIQSAASETTKERLSITGTQSGPAVDPAEMAATLMTQGKPVGEGWIWGIGAVELAARRLISAEVMQAYRSGAFFARRDAYGEESALAWETAAKARHEDAKGVWRSVEEKREQRRVSIPNKSTGIPANFAA
jgi:hypothetical protein